MRRPDLSGSIVRTRSREPPGGAQAETRDCPRPAGPRPAAARPRRRTGPRGARPDLVGIRAAHHPGFDRRGLRARGGAAATSGRGTSTGCSPTRPGCRSGSREAVLPGHLPGSRHRARRAGADGPGAHGVRPAQRHDDGPLRGTSRRWRPTASGWRRRPPWHCRRCATPRAWSSTCGQRSAPWTGGSFFVDSGHPRPTLIRSSSGSAAGASDHPGRGLWTGCSRSRSPSERAAGLLLVRSARRATPG